jgi:hypothetical protein
MSKKDLVFLLASLGIVKEDKGLDTWQNTIKGNKEVNIRKRHKA